MSTLLKDDDLLGNRLSNGVLELLSYGKEKVERKTNPKRINRNVESHLLNEEETLKILLKDSFQKESFNNQQFLLIKQW